jgi:hypothetical protein
LGRITSRKRSDSIAKYTVTPFQGHWVNVTKQFAYVDALSVNYHTLYLALFVAELLKKKEN